MTTQFRKTGLGVLGEMAWGSHCCHFYQTREPSAAWPNAS